MEIKLINFVLLNRTNYAIWKIQCKMTLIKDGLWNIANEIDIIPDPRAEMTLHMKYLSWNDCALVTIVLSVEPSLLYLIRDTDDPVVAWKKLANQFQKKTWANKLALRRKLYSPKLKECDTLHNYIKMMTEIFKDVSY